MANQHRFYRPYFQIEPITSRDKWTTRKGCKVGACHGCYYKPIKLKIMKQEELNNILRNLLVAGNIVTVPFEQMREIRKELNRFVKPIQIEVIKSSFETVSFRELRQ